MPAAKQNRLNMQSIQALHPKRISTSFADIQKATTFYPMLRVGKNKFIQFIYWMCYKKIHSRKPLDQHQPPNV